MPQPIDNLNVPPTAVLKYQRVLESILNDVASGRLGHGDKLPPERELAATLGVTRTNVREAIRHLSQKGLLQSRQGDGTYVCVEKRNPLREALKEIMESRNNTIQHLMEFRHAIEPSIAELAAAHISEEQLRELKVIVCDQQCRVFAGKEDRDLNAQFHLSLARATNNPIFCALLEHLNQVLLEVWPAGSRDFMQQQHSINDHLRLVGALENKDPKASRLAMEQHLSFIPTSY